MEHFETARETSIPFHERVDLMSKQEMTDLIHCIDFAKSNSHLHEQLYALHKNGPVWDGDIISKSDRDELLDIGACSKVSVKGEQGYNACTYFGKNLLNIYDWLHGEK